jgi:hypothetical protein
VSRIRSFRNIGYQVFIFTGKVETLNPVRAMTRCRH